MNERGGVEWGGRGVEERGMGRRRKRGRMGKIKKKKLQEERRVGERGEGGGRKRGVEDGGRGMEKEGSK